MKVRSRKWDILLVVAACLVSAGLMELVSYFVIYRRNQSYRENMPVDDRMLRIFTETDDGLPFGVRPHFSQRFLAGEFDTTVSTNNVGFRGKRDYLGGAIDIGLLGDSFVWGYGVNDEEILSERLQAALPEKRVFGYAYRNGGYPVDYYLFFKRYPEFIPRLTVFTMFLMNDLTTDPRMRIYGYDSEKNISAAPSKVMQVMPDGSIVVRGLSVTYYPVLKWLSRFYFGKVFLLAWGKYVTGTYINIDGNRLIGDDVRRQYYHGKLDGTALETLDYVVKTKELAEKKGSRFVVFLIPEAFHIGDSPRCPLPPEECAQLRDTPVLQATLREWLEKKGVQVLDPTDDFKRRTKSGQALYYVRDAHWTPEGHAAAAEFLRNALEADGLLGAQN